MEDHKNRILKDYDKQLLIYFSINLVIFICIFINKNITIKDLNQTYSNITLDGGMIAGGSLVVFILKGVLSANIKASLVFWRIKDPLPGCRIFTELGKKDYRIDFKVLESKYGTLPTEPKEQNKLWYKFLVQYRDDDMIFKSHRDYLYSRDLTGLAFLFFIFYSLAAIVVGKNIKVVEIYIFILFVVYVIISIVGRIYGNRFACNVLAKEYSSIKMDYSKIQKPIPHN